MITAVASAVLGERVLRFCARHPDMRVEIIEDAAEHLVQELLSGSLNLVLCRRPQPLPAKLHFEALRPDEAVVIAGAEPPAGRAPGPDARRPAAATPGCARRRGVWMREVFDALFEEAGIQPAPAPGVARIAGAIARDPARQPDHRDGPCRHRSFTVSVEPGGDARRTACGTPRGEIGVLCAAESLEDPICLEFMAALRAETEREPVPSRETK